MNQVLEMDIGRSKDRESLESVTVIARQKIFLICIFGGGARCCSSRMWSLWSTGAAYCASHGATLHITYTGATAAGPG